ncbi:MAG: nitrate reductase [Verrucomicrobia bacterium]|nr:nitrate reductase [Verrucomicrobiota bacterium]MDE3099863.1 nitrate reductase [Verrucomicrobiota bacterium]
MTPAQQVRTVCPYCGVGCGVILHVAGGRVAKATGDKLHPANFGRLCSKGFTCAEPLNASDRLMSAFARQNRVDKLEPLPLEDALLQSADRLRQIIERHGPDAVAFYVSGQLSTEAQYLANKLCKGFLRTNNIDSNSRLCMSSAASGYKLSLGADAPPGSYSDIEQANCFLAIGANMAECHPILFLRALERRKRGAKLIVVDPRRTATAEKADLFLQIKPGTDLALLNGLLHLLVKNNRVDEQFIARHTDGWAELREFLTDYTPPHVAEITGLREEDIRLAATWIGEAPEFMTFWTMGLNQSTHGTWHTNAICNLHLATGKICRPGSGPFSLTGQPNAMGGREVGYLSHLLPGQRTVTNAEDRAFIEQLWNLPPNTIRPEPGLEAVELFKKLEAGKVKAVWIIGTNPVASMPNRSRVITGLQRAELVVVQDAFHPTETSRFADILLPGALWAEADGTMVNSERTITLMQPAVAPPGEAQADWRIISRVAGLLGYERHFDYESAGEVFDEIRETSNLETGYDLRGISYEQLRQQPQQWPCAPGETVGRPVRYAAHQTPTSVAGLEGSSARAALRFPTASGKAQFFARPCLPPAEMPNAGFPFVLTTGRVAHQWHTLTKTGKVAALNKLNPGPFLEIHPEDAATLDLENGAAVKIRSRRGFAILPALVTPRVRPGNCFAPFHWNDLFGENLAVNAATNEAVDADSLQPEFKFAAVALAKVELEDAGDFTSEQKRILQELLLNRNSRRHHANGHGPPVLPETAPFTTDQRRHINKMLARLCAGDLPVESRP